MKWDCAVFAGVVLWGLEISTETKNSAISMLLPTSKKHLLLGSVFISLSFGAVTASAAKNPGAKTPDHSFYPSTSWSIGKAENFGTAGASCSLTTEFNNGFQMQLSASNQELSSFDMNFRQGVFQAGSNLNVTLNVPGLARETLPAVASSAETLSVNLAGQGHLYRRMKESAVVDLEVSGNEFRFYLTGFSGAAERFETCLTSRPAAASIQASAPQAAPAPIEWKAAPAPQPQRSAAAYQSQITEDLDGRAPPPPRTSLSIPPVRAAAPGQYDPFDPYSRELSAVMPEEREYKVPIQEVYPDDMNVPREISRPAAVSPRPVYGRQRLTEMLADEMARQHDQMQEDGYYIETYKEGAEITSPPLRAPLVQKGSAAEQALVDILMGGGDEKPAASKAEEAPVKLEGNTNLVIKPHPNAKSEAPKKQGFQPVVNKTTSKIEADLTEIGMPPAPKRPAKSGKNWMEVRKDKKDHKRRPSKNEQSEMLAAETSGAADPRVQSLESEVSALNRENAELQSELDFALEQSKEESIAISSDNWNLELASKQYNEAKRQIDRMGRQIRKERAACIAEKKELETMLFDPELTGQEQLAKLAKLEDKLAEAERKLKEQRQTYEARIKLLESSVGVR